MQRCAGSPEVHRQRAERSQFRSGRFYSFGASRTSADINLIVTQTGSSTAFANHPLASNFGGVFAGTVDLAKAFETPRKSQESVTSQYQNFQKADLPHWISGINTTLEPIPSPDGGNVEFRGAGQHQRFREAPRRSRRHY